MIAPMKKVYLVLLEGEKEAGLVALRRLGLVHIETARPSGESWDRAARDYDTLSAAINLLPQSKTPPASELGLPEAVELARGLVDREARKSAIYAELGTLTRELERCSPWGEVDPQALRELESGGLFLRLYACEAKAVAGIPAELEYLVLSRGNRGLRLATVGRGAPAPELGPEFLPFALPESSTAGLRDKIAALKAELEAIAAQGARDAAHLAALKRASAWLAERKAFETARSSVGADSGFCYLKGFVPASGAASLAAAAKAQGWALIVDEPSAEDVTPTKVENGPFVSIIKPVFDFLGIVPAYTEYEISPWFLGFFTLFTAMIFGDGGYGALLLAVWALLALKAKRAGKGQSAFNKLLFMIAALTMAWGAATGTWFSLPVDSLPTFMRGLWPISNANPQASQNIQVLCFVLGALQLSIARIKNVLRDLPNPKFLAQVGSLLLIVGMFFGVLFLVVDPERFPLPGFTIWLILGGFALSMIFGAYEGNVLKSLLEGLKNIIPNFLGAVGVFADIVSYIRLWALGLAGSALAGIINGMGGGMVKPALIGLVGVIILLVGHGLNLILSVLSVIVHAVRLNILEFSCNHLGMQWSGIAYDPFKVNFEEDAEKRKESGV